jgi:imidazolonepropionase-like amidohydrolase
MNRVLFLALTLLVMSACAPAESESDEAVKLVTYFEHGRVLVGDGTVIEDAAFVVEDGIITAIGPASEVAHPAGSDRFDLGNHTVMPFLHNLHGHVGYGGGAIFSASLYSRESILEDLNRYLYYGIGSVAVLGSDTGDVAFEIRADQKAGTVGGARLFTAGRGITGRGGWPTTIPALADAPIQVASEDEARQAVRDMAAKQVDFIKVWVDDNRSVTGQIYRGGRLTDQYSTIPKMRSEYYEAVIDEAHQNNIRVVAHVLYLNDAKSLIAAGVDGLVHSIRDRNVDQALIDAMLENDVFYVPTLTGHESAFIYGDEPDWVGEQAMRETVSASSSARLTSPRTVGLAKQDPNSGLSRRQYATALRNLKTLADAGVKIGMGTDSGAMNRFPGYFEHRELKLMVDAGMTPEQAIRAATLVSAEILGVAETTGTLAPGRQADFLLMPSDPMEDILNTRDIAEVFQGGLQVDRSAIILGFSQ